MISEVSRDTEDWSNDAENSDLYHRNKLSFKIHWNKITFIIIQNITVLLYFGSNKCSLGEHKLLAKFFFFFYKLHDSKLLKYDI